MKKIFLFLILGIFLISFVSAFTRCSPDPDFDFCWENSESFGDATANAKVQISNVQGTWKGGYYLGDTLIQYKFEGDNFYIYENPGSWSNLWSNIANCNENGCTGTAITRTGVHRLTKDPGEQYTNCPVFVSWDKDTAPDGSWAWTTSVYGWAGNGNCFNIRQVECFEDSDCNLNEICDKSGTWQEWDCKQRQTFYRFENNQCSSISLLPSEKTSNDYNSLLECEENIVEETSRAIVILTVTGIFGAIVFLVWILTLSRKGR